MGCQNTKPVESAESKEISKQLKSDKKSLDSLVKLLLLGAGESGKSTIAKQMKILHTAGFSEEERKSYTSIIHNNMVSSMRHLIMACENMSIPIVARDSGDRLLKHSDEFFSGSFEEIVEDLTVLWKEDGIQKAFAQSAKFQLIDSASYYFSHLQRIASPNFIPTEQDVLRCRAKTTGIIELKFTIENTQFLLVDVGGQRSERKKWMFCFQDVTAVIFCVAMSEYDLKLQEDDSTNRMLESLKLFREICNSTWFVETSMILFLNKRDLFEQKIKKVDLKVAFEDYDGGLDYENASQFMKSKFLAQSENSSKVIYVHFTCATDTDNVKIVFNAVRDIVLRAILARMGI